MNIFLMTTYVLVWPVLVVIMMAVIGRGVVQDFRRARRRGEDVL